MAASLLIPAVLFGQESNPLLAPWKGPYGGVPPFEKVEVKHFMPAFEVAIPNALKEIDAIANNPKPATFSNTIEAMELAGQQYDRVVRVYYVWTSNLNSPEVEAIQTKISVMLSEYDDKVKQNSALFKRIEAVYEGKEYATLNSEQKRLVWNYHNNFVLSGAKLNPEQKKQISEINQELTTLYTKFGNNQLADEAKKHVLISSEADLAGLPADLKEGYAQAAKDAGKTGWLINNTRSAVEPFLSAADNRELRKQVWQMFINRGDNGDENDNNKIISQIVALRQRKAKVMGYATHAHLRLADKMAKTPERAMQLMEQVWKPAVKMVSEEVDLMTEVAKKRGENITIEPWDYRYYMEKVRQDKYNVNSEALKPYFQMDLLREGMFMVAGKLFDLGFKPAKDVPVFHPDVKVWEVYNLTTNKHVGLWYFDPYARAGKNSGAWMTDYRAQHKLGKGSTTLVSNNSNFIKGKPGEAVLVSMDDANTLFHEFGHALHGLCSDVTYPSVSGTNTPTDFVEFPSQLLEDWLLTPEVLNKYVLHYQTKQPIDAATITRIQSMGTFNQGFSTVEALSGALVDMKLHLSLAPSIDADEFERTTLQELGMPKEMVMRHRMPQFGHVFSSDQYSAGYYSYLWADVLTSDCFEAFLEGDGPYDKAVAKKLKTYIFAAGNTRDQAEAYKLFRGRDASPEALMRKRGFAPKKDFKKKK